MAVSGKLLRHDLRISCEEFDRAVRLLRNCPDLEVLWNERHLGDSTYYWKPNRPAVWLAVRDANDE